jgi:hypothetical protein
MLPADMHTSQIQDRYCDKTALWCPAAERLPTSLGPVPSDKLESSVLPRVVQFDCPTGKKLLEEKPIEAPLTDQCDDSRRLLRLPDHSTWMGRL